MRFRWLGMFFRLPALSGEFRGSQTHCEATHHAGDLRSGGLRKICDGSGVLAGTVGVSWCGSDFDPRSWFAFATFEHRFAFNSFECGNVPFLHLAMKAGGYLSVETAKPDRDVGCSARWKASVSAGAGRLLASDPGFAFTAIEHRCAFNRFECGDVPFLHLAMKAGGYLSVETAKPDRDVGCSARWKASVSAGAGPLLASDPGFAFTAIEL